MLWSNLKRRYANGAWQTTVHFRHVLLKHIVYHYLGPHKTEYKASLVRVLEFHVESHRISSLQSLYFPKHFGCSHYCLLFLFYSKSSTDSCQIVLFMPYCIVNLLLAPASCHWNYIFTYSLQKLSTKNVEEKGEDRLVDSV